MQNVLKVIVKMDKGLIHILMEITLENGKMVKETDKELSHMPVETNMLENGKMIKLLNEKNFMDGNNLWGKVV